MKHSVIKRGRAWYVHIPCVKAEFPHAEFKGMSFAKFDEHFKDVALPHRKDVYDCIQNAVIPAEAPEVTSATVVEKPSEEGAKAHADALAALGESPAEEAKTKKKKK